MNLYLKYKWLLLSGFFLVAMQIPQYSFSQPHGTGYWMIATRPTGISPQEAAAIAQRAIGGRVLSVNRDSSHYRIKILNDKGHIQVVTVDAGSGAVLSTR